MSKLKEYMVFLLQNTKHKLGLTNAKLTKMLYLADWVFCLKYGKQMSCVKWYYDTYGPYVPDMKKEAELYPAVFIIKECMIDYDYPKTVIQLLNNSYMSNLNKLEKETLTFIINLTDNLAWDDFIKLIYSTNPIQNSERYSFLDLVHCSKRYKTFN